MVATDEMEVSTTGLVDTKRRGRTGQASAMARGIEASDRRRDAGAGLIGFDYGAAPRREPQPSFQMAA